MAPVVKDVGVVIIVVVAGEVTLTVVTLVVGTDLNVGAGVVALTVGTGVVLLAMIEGVGC